MTDAHAQHPPVRYQARPDQPLPPMVAEPKQRRGRRSTAVKAQRTFRSHRLTTYGFAAVILILGVVDGLVYGDWIFPVACICFTAVTVTTQFVAESDIELARARAGAEHRLRAAAQRDLRQVSDAYDDAHAIIRHNDPALADDLASRLTLDLRRAHLMTHRLESDARG